MTLEAVDRPIRYCWPGGEVRLEPGLPVEVPDDRARRLLTKLGGRVRIVQQGGAALLPGQIVTWQSPALGTLSGELLAIHGDGSMSVFHPLTEAVARIPLSWLRAKEDNHAA